MEVNLENLYRDIGAKGLISGEDNELPIYSRFLSSVYTITLCHVTCREILCFLSERRKFSLLISRGVHVVLLINLHVAPLKFDCFFFCAPN